MATTITPLRHASGERNTSQQLLNDRSNANLRFMGHVRNIREEAQNLIRYANELKGKLTDQHLKIADVAKEWQSVQMPAYQQNSARVQELFTGIKKLMEDNPVLLDRDSDTITRMENVWERIDSQWPRFPDNGPSDQNALLAQIDAVDALLCEVIKEAEILTLPGRVNERLRQLRVGQTIDFHTDFSEELPELASRIIALHYLHDRPLMVMGVVDVENGLIYRASSRVWRRRLSPVYITLFAILGAILVYLSLTFLPLLSSGKVPHKIDDVLPYLTVYITLIAGGFAHTAVETVKQYRSGQGKTFTALGDLVMWIHVKQAPIIGGIVLLWIGFIGLYASQQGADWGAAFFVGYSIDSFVDLFLQRFTSVASSRTNTLGRQLAQLPSR